MTKRSRRGRSLEGFKREVYLCSRCGYCIGMVRARDATDLVCPVQEGTGGFDSFTAKGRNIISRGILEGKLSTKNVSPEFVDNLFACTLCGSCQEHCPALDPDTWNKFPDNKFTDHKVNVLGIAEALRALIIEKGNPPAAIKHVLQNIQLHGNPEGRPRYKREEYLKELDFQIKKAREGECDTLLYVGSVASYNQRNQKTVVAISKILHASKVDFCVLGNEEEDSGADALRLGEEGLFEMLAERNLTVFKKYKIKNVICVSPHDYDAFINDYPVYLKDDWSRLKIKVQHYTDFIAEALRSRDLTIKKKLDRNVTFQDPCYLGRINGILDAPRRVIQATGAKVVDMRLSRRNSYCCGGGGGGIWFESVHNPRLQTQRAKQACETQADVLAVACPVCEQMLEKGLIDLERCQMKVMDVAEILLEAIGEASK